MMRLVIFDDNNNEIIAEELEKAEVIAGKDSNVAHYKLVRKTSDDYIIVNFYKKTDEEATTYPIKEVEGTAMSMKTKIDMRDMYGADVSNLIGRANQLSMMAGAGMQAKTCIYCGEIAMNEYNKKPVCSSCFKVLSQYGENSDEFRRYIRSRLLSHKPKIH